MKKMRKIRMIFDLENWLWTYEFGTFQLSCITSIYTIPHFPWSPFYFFDKMRLILDTPGPNKKTWVDIIILKTVLCLIFGKVSMMDVFNVNFLFFSHRQRIRFQWKKRGSILCVIKQQIVDFCEITKSQHAKRCLFLGHK